jgi:hypothetical protein
MALTGLVAANNLSDVVDIERTWDNIGNNISATVFVPAATLDLNFAGNKSLIDNISGSGLVTFTRASSGTFVGSNGLIQTAASGVPRFDHDPATGESLGLLVEEARTNLVTYSEQLNNVAWSSISTGTPVVTLNALAAPDGTITGDLIVGNNINTWIANNAGAVSAGQYSFSVWLKSDIAQTADIFMSFGVTDALTCSVTTSWQRFTLTATRAATAGLFAGINVGNAKNIYVWGAQLETGAFSTSYIPTVASTVTRAADVASMTGTNFSSWYNQSQGTFFVSARQSSYSYGQALVGLGTGTGALGLDYAGPTTTKGGSWWNGGTAIGTSNYADWGNGAKLIGSYTSSNRYLCLNGGAIASNASTLINGGLMRIGQSYNTNGLNSNGTIARLTYYPIQLSNTALQVLTTSGPVSSFPYSFSIKGRDILALKEVNKTSTRDFVFIKGLLSRVQPRINTASQYTASGVALRNAAMLKVAPTTAGNYLFSSGLTLSGTTVQINGTNARSIATSPFSSSTATVPLLFAGLRPQANWRITEPMASGTVTSPESAIPIETSDFLLFIKAGQS